MGILQFVSKHNARLSIVFTFTIANYSFLQTNKNLFLPDTKNYKLILRKFQSDCFINYVIITFPFTLFEVNNKS